MWIKRLFKMRFFGKKLPETLEELKSRLNVIRLKPKTILICGEGASLLKSALKSRYLNAQFTISPGFSEEPSKGLFDLILGIDLPGERERFEPLFPYFFEALRPEGLLLFTQWDRETDPHYPDMHDIGDLLLALGFENPVVDRELSRIFGLAWKPKDRVIKVALDQIKTRLKNPIESV